MSTDPEIVITEEESQPEPKPEPTKLERFKQALAQYPDKETAKTHILEIANRLGCAKSLGYKALKQIDQFKPQGQIEAREATVKIHDQAEIPLEADQEEQAPPQEVTEEATEETSTQPPAASTLPLTPDQLSKTMKIGMDKIAKLLEYPDMALSKEEADILGNAWQPVIQMYAPQLIANPLFWASITTVMIFAPRIGGYWKDRQKKKAEKPLPEQKQQTSTPKTETSKPAEPTQPTEAAAPLEKPTTDIVKPTSAPFLKKL
jgi:hypothetical protein